MATEYERKYLVLVEDWRESASEGSLIAQGYISENPNASVRVRISSDEVSITVKGPPEGQRRLEFVYPIPLDEAQQMLDEIASSSLSKTRHMLPFVPYSWTIDDFSGANSRLVLLEIEDQASPVIIDSLPAWVGPEVTGDPRFSNAYLSGHPYNEWADAFLDEIQELLR